MRPLIYFLLHPITIGVLLLAAGWLLHRLIRGRWRRSGFFVALAYWVLLLLTPVPKLLVDSLESQYAPVKELDCAEARYIMVLASGFTHDMRLPATSQLNNASRARLTEGIRLWRQCSDATLVVSGPDNDEGISQSAITAHAARQLGVPDSALARLHDPFNTAGEAEAFRKQFGSGQSLILVTSAVHMPRSVYWFRHHGHEPIPAPANYAIKKDESYRWYIFSPVQNIGLVDQYLHEKVGMWYAKLVSG